MPLITFIETDGTRHELHAMKNVSAMSVAVQNGVKGILAECGGGCACATCHVYVDESCFSLLPGKDIMEEMLLESSVEDLRPTSRLSCQIKLIEDYDGKLILHVPATQG